MDDSVSSDITLQAEPLAEESPVVTAEESADSLLQGDMPTWRVVFLLAWPVLLQQVLTISVNFSDRLLAGRFQALASGDHAASMAALTTANYLAYFILNYSTLVTVGSTALVARCIGGRDRETAIRATNQSLFLACMLGVVASIVGLIGVEPFLAMLRLDPTASAFAVSYLRPIFLSLPFLIVQLAGVACLAGAGDTRIGLIVLALVAGLNIPLSWFFFHGGLGVPALGFTGIAVGTAISHTVGGVAILVVLWRGRAGLQLRPALLLPDWSLLRRILRVSVPAGLDALSVSVGHLWFLSIVNHLGNVASGAHGIAIYWEALGYGSGAAFGVAATTLVGQHLGAGQPERASRSGWTACVMGIATMSFMGGVFFVLAKPMFQLFCPNSEQAALVETGAPVLRLVAFAMPGLASAIIFTHALRGAGDTRVPVLFTWIGFFGVRIPLAYLFTRPSFGLGLYGAWLAMCIDIYIRGLFFLWRFAGGRWQRIEV